MLIFSRNMDSNNEYTSDIDIQNEGFSNNIVKRKATQEPVKKSNVKKIWVNITNTDSKTKKLSYVWKYFQMKMDVMFVRYLHP